MNTMNINIRIETKEKGRALSFLLFYLFTFLPFFFSCDSFLEEEPKGELTQQQAYGSEELLLRNAVLTIYNYIGGSSNSCGLQGTDRGVYDLNSMTTDEQIVPTRGGDWYDGGLWQRLYLHTWTAGEGPLKDTWDYLFRVVILCNEGLERIDASTLAIDKETMKAELRAVRAMYYFYLMDLYGRVPLVTTTGGKSSELWLSERREVFLWIVSELQQSLPLLADEPSQHTESQYYGRMTAPVVRFLLAKLMLNAEVYYDNDWTDGQTVNGSDIIFNVEGQTAMNAWQAAEYYCAELEGAYSLSDDYTANFAPGNETSPENIFTIPMDPSAYANVYNYFFRSRHYSHGAYLGGASENGPCATLSTIRAFGYGTDNPDPRLRHTFYYDEVQENGQTVFEDDGVTPLVYHPLDVTAIDLTGTLHEKTAGARLHKYPHDPTSRADGRMQNNDIVLFRYADVLLMRAEALVRQAKPQEAVAYFNQVRQRAGAATLPTVTLDDILRERLLEFCWEGWRRNDLIRFGTFCEPYDLKQTAGFEQDRHTIVFPIPADLITMHPDWQQNKGY